MKKSLKFILASGILLLTGVLAPTAKVNSQSDTCTNLNSGSGYFVCVAVIQNGQVVGSTCQKESMEYDVICQYN